ncbi:MAG: TIGR02757 family protein [Sedimentisphaerales bacterium]
MIKRIEHLKEVLERLYTKYNRSEFIPPDPLQFLYKYSNPADKEVVGFLSAALAYGRVEQIEKSLTDLFGRMGPSPYAFVRDFGEAGREKLRSFKHRFTTGQDISDLLQVLQDVFEQKGCIENYFLLGYSEKYKNIIPALSKFCESLLEVCAKKYNGRINQGLKYLLANPSAGSACKRLNLFLRWMVRKDEVDLGLWSSIDKAKLIVPVDVHMARLCRILEFHSRKTVSLSMAVQITEGFAKIVPADPVKYDFALSRIGILEDCNGKYRPECEDCELLEFCSRK